MPRIAGRMEKTKADTNERNIGNQITGMTGGIIMIEMMTGKAVANKTTETIVNVIGITIPNTAIINMIITNITDTGVFITDLTIIR
jgi:hypothetical protein